jgi:hypothetical protein
MIVTIETKFDIGDVVWFIKGGRPSCAKVYHLHTSLIRENEDYVFTTYRLRSPYGEEYLEDFFESRIFPTKESLLKHIEQ